MFHPLLVPWAEKLFLLGQVTIRLRDGHNDWWLKAIPFCGSRPQPDHAVGFKESAFTELQRRKLGIKPTAESYYTVGGDICFPFLTSEVKCASQPIEVADRANAQSMTITLRGVVEPFRKVGRPMAVHRRVLAFSISHDHATVCLYAHYPEIDGDKTSFYPYTIKQIDCSTEVEKWTCKNFTRNIYKEFAPSYLGLSTEATDQLLDPVDESSNLAIAPEDESVLSSEDISSSVAAELRSMIMGLQQQMGQQ